MNKVYFLLHSFFCSLQTIETNLFSLETLESFLEKLGLGKLIELFQNKEIDLQTLLKCNSQQLGEICFALKLEIGIKIKLEQAINERSNEKNAFFAIRPVF